MKKSAGSRLSERLRAAATTALVGHTLKKPLATVLLLMIVFPARLIPIMLFAAAAAKFVPTPNILLAKGK